MNIRYAKITDFVQLTSLMEQLMEKKCDKEDIKYRLDKILKEENHHIIVCDNEKGKLLGTAMGIVCIDIYKSNFMVIENVVVDESSRGQDIGKLLMEELEKIARDNECWYINLVSSDFRKGAHKFYEKNGFKREGGFRKML